MADDKTIKEAFRRLAMKYHPDRNKAPGAEERFKRIAEAYAVLGDPEKRAQYDAGGLGAEERAEFRTEDIFEDVDIGDIFGGFEADLFGGPFRWARRPRGSGRGADVIVELRIPLERVLRGGEESVRFEGRTASVRIPPGVEEGNTLRVAGHGMPATRAGSLAGDPWESPTGGDLLVRVSTMPHPRFERHGADLIGVVSIPVHDAVLGTQVVVPTLDGKAKVSIRPGTQPESTLRLRGAGLPRMGGGPRGDLYLRVRVVVPTSPSNRERRLWAEIRTVAGEEPDADEHAAARRH